MRDNNMKRIIRSGRPAIGSTVTIPDPFVAEVMGGAGMDFLIIETEHSPMSATLLQTILIALRASESTIVVRVPGQGDTEIKQALDIGAEAIIVPGVSTRDECERVVASARYGPEGARGFGPRRASRLYGERADYIARANDEILVLPMIETAEALENLDDILSTPGVDGIMVGPFDLAVSLGYRLDPGNEAVDSAIEQILDGCVRHDIPFGMFTATKAVALKWVERGARIVTLGSDLSYVDAGIKRTREEAEPIRAVAPALTRAGSALPVSVGGARVVLRRLEACLILPRPW
jgi:2-keto-3-deoxy-L-rhamnonate aldolase RhmA